MKIEFEIIDGTIKLGEIKRFYSVILTQNNVIFIIFHSTPHIIIFMLIRYISNDRNNYKPIIIQWIVWFE